MENRTSRLPLLASILTILALSTSSLVSAQTSQMNQPSFAANDNRIQYVGRIDMSNPKLPKFWSPGVYINAEFTGTYCDVLLNDQVLWGNTHNFVEIVVDGNAKRIHLADASSVIKAAEGLPDGKHTLTICKDTESGMGYLEFAGLNCAGLDKPAKLPKRKIEFIGDSITAGASCDTSMFPCGQGPWYGQHNAYMSYGPQTARLLNSQWMVSAVSGIGLIHSCCNMSFTMPDVYDQIANRAPSDTFAAGAKWDFSRYQPDVVTVCLGQNDGTANSDQFVSTYEALVEHLRGVHPKSHIVLLTSPMGNAELTAAMKVNLAEVVKHENDNGDKNVSSYFFSRSWNDGCGDHPSVANHTEIAGELSNYLKTLMDW